MTIRQATVNDARRIAEVQVAGWKTTYRAIFPASVLEALSVEKWEASWNQRLSEARADLITLVASGPRVR